MQAAHKDSPVSAVTVMSAAKIIQKRFVFLFLTAGWATEPSAEARFMLSASDVGRLARASLYWRLMRA